MTSSLQTEAAANAAQQGQPAPCRIASEIEGMREELLARICRVIGQDLTPEEIQALPDSPLVMEHVRFEVDKALRKVIGHKLT
jgi:hypothetical protein